MFFSFALNTYGTLNMFLLSVQTKFYIILSSYVEGDMKKILVSVLSIWFVSRSPKCGCFFGKFNVELVLKSFSGRNNSLAFEFPNII